MSSTPTSTKILLLGAGELGTAFLYSLTALSNIHITIGVRNPTKYAHFKCVNVDLTQLDTTAASGHLAETFSHYDILISATGFGQPPGTVTKLAKEALLAGKLKFSRNECKLWFFPWQWGVDYDITGDGQGLMPLFGEQVAVRNILRQEAEDSNVKWTIVSTGIFMSFLFDPVWELIDESQEKDGKLKVRCLGSWQHKVTVTDVHDIGRVLAKIIAGDVEAEDRVLYIAGDTVSYGDLAGIVEKVSGKEVEREEWTIPCLEEVLSKDTEDGIKRYRLVFARKGVWWGKEETVNAKLGMNMLQVESYARELFIRQE
ncbi:NAD(P)-binding protein [Dothidotthia symphoricarpi CBS 119687]|uniref:NAD(P)-binding protein n=1 Tax=Dothidotthia symphoricarpi CBS 119687 TaxID=1392245 RepID=A0A6A6APK5_9PLEO|nr:NAD(P)-binding protein [Dothidotthia symphoricarpi CBS 119687]KAF2132817.1 NAD(P)-binding protein [Dothidotthia symphoricarpi CBS 119687]